MKVVLDGAKKVSVKGSSKPEKAPNQAVIRPIHVGICGSDMLKYTGRYIGLTYPNTPGHEFTGTVVEIENNEKFDIGDMVVVNPNISCGECRYCCVGRRYLCENLITIGSPVSEGAMQDYIQAPVRNLISIDKSIYSPLFSLTEPLSIAVHAAHKSDNGNALFLGFGNIGLLLFLVWKKQNKEITVVDIDEIQLRLAQSMNANTVLNYETLQSTIDDYIDSFETIFINCPFDSDLLSTAIALTVRGGNIIIVGLPHESINLDFKTLMNKEIVFQPSFKNSEDDFREAFDYIKVNADLIRSIIETREFSMEQAAKAFEYKLAHPNVKVILKNTMEQ